MKFFETNMGRKFFEVMIPRIVIALERIGDELERARHDREIDREVERARYLRSPGQGTNS